MSISIDINAAVELVANYDALVDDTTFNTVQTSVAYNASGMSIQWVFVSTAGVVTVTSVTPTTGGGSYDWAHKAGGIYSLKMPASGGASINNNAAGYGYFRGKATGVAGWVSPIYVFRASGLNDALIDSAWDANRGLAGLALPNAVAGAAGSVNDATRIGGTTQTGGDIYAYLTTNLGALGANLSAIPKTGFKLAADGLSAISAWTVALTGNITGNLSGSVGSVTNGVTVATNNDKTGYSISGTLTTLDALWNKVKAWLGAIAGKTADAVTRAEINATTAGASFNETTDSLEAVRDRGDAAWLTATGFSTLDAAGVRSAVGLATANLDAQFGAIPTAGANADAVRTELTAELQTLQKLETTLEADGGGYRFTENALEQAPAGGGGGGGDTIIVQPLQSTVDGRVKASTINAFAGENGWTIGPVVVVDGNGDPVDLTALDELTLIIQDNEGADLLVTTEIDISGDDNNQWTAIGTAAVTGPVAARRSWTLRELGGGKNIVYGRGKVIVSNAAEED